LCFWSESMCPGQRDENGGTADAPCQFSDCGGTRARPMTRWLRRLYAPARSGMNAGQFHTRPGPGDRLSVDPDQCLLIVHCCTMLQAMRCRASGSKRYGRRHDTSDMTLAPWLPPKVTTRRMGPYPLELSAGYGFRNQRHADPVAYWIAGEHLFPIQRDRQIWWWGSSSPEYRQSAPSARFARPITAFCSCRMPGMPSRLAAINGGKVG
jgi:hypothetical protein